MLSGSFMKITPRVNGFLALLVFLLGYVGTPAWAVDLAVSDTFPTIAYNGSDGIAPSTNPGPWVTPWLEIGENNGPRRGRVQIVTNKRARGVNNKNCFATSCLRIGDNEPVKIANRGASRAVNLSGDVVTANLTFLYRRLINSPSTGSGGVLVQVSPNGTTWTTLSKIRFGGASDKKFRSASFNIKPYAAAGTQIRFLGQGNNAKGAFHIDNVKVAWALNNPTVAAPAPAPVPGALAFTGMPYNFTVNANAAVGTAVGTVSATDPKGGPVAYTITVGNTNNAFTINPSTGAITVATTPLTGNTYNLTVSATDTSGAHVEAPVTVTVIPVTVDLKLLVIATGSAALDGAFDYIQRFLDQAGVPYDVLNAGLAGRAALTSADLAVSATHGRYNGIILTDTIVFNPATGTSHLSSSEWAALHSYERDFKVREAVLSGVPTYSWPQCVSPTFINCDYDYGMVDGSPVNNINPANTATTLSIQAQWNSGVSQFAYVNKTNPWAITNFAWYATPRNPTTTPPTTPPAVVTATPILTEQATGKALISQLTYPDGREVLLSSINNAWFYLYSDALAREFVNFATKGVFIGESKAYLNIHVDDLFLGDNHWDPVNNVTPADLFARLTGAEVSNVVAAQNSFHTVHPLASAVKMEFAFNGVGVGPTGLPASPPQTCTDLITAAFGSANPLPTELADSTSAIQVNQANFGFINHSYTHMDLDYSRNTDSGGPSSVANYNDQIACNRLVWQKLALPEYNENLNIMVTGEHSGLKDDGWHDDAGATYCYADSYLSSHCVAETAAPLPEPALNVLLNDPNKAFPYSGNPRFFETAQGLGMRYLASDASQVNQNVERLVTNVPNNRHLGATPTQDFNLVLLPRYPTNIFYNVSYPGALVDCSTQTIPPTDPNCQPGSLVDEYNNIFRERPLALNGNVDYCVGGIAQPPYQGSICAPRSYAEILAAEADTAVMHMLSWQKYPHFFHEINLKNYDGLGKTLIFDWLNAVMTRYEGYMNLPVKSLPYWQVGQLTEQRLNARNANITGVLNVTLGTVTLQATNPPATGTVNAIVTGVAGGAVSGGQSEIYGTQTIGTIPVGQTPVTVQVSP